MKDTISTGGCPVRPDLSSCGKCPFAHSEKLNNKKIPPKDPLSVVPEAYRNKTLTPRQKELIKASVPALQSHGVDITTSFYQHAFNDNPGLKDVFNLSHQTTGLQQKALAGSVLAYAANIDDLTPLSSAVTLIANKHASLYVRPEQYVVVGTYLLAAIERVLGSAVTPELLEAWAAAYWQLAAIFISTEDQMYRELPVMADWTDFRIAKKEIESTEICSFYLEPVDSSLSLLPYKPGQYISVRVWVPELDHFQPRQYSLSDAPNSTQYRISVKREKGDHPGTVSNIMHDIKQVGDVIQVSAPRGDFYLDTTIESSHPIVLISAGVGLTSVNSILQSVIAKTPSRSISWIHGAHDTKSRAFASQILKRASEVETLRVAYFNSAVTSQDVEGEDYHFSGRIDLDKLDRNLVLHLNHEETRYYVCGPGLFMQQIADSLKSRGVSSDRISMEVFSVGDGA